MKPNRLQTENSLYLRQHAWNPVDWQPWDNAALAQARHENKPILLSIGYSACHWCHVMAHESFEDTPTAALMNKHYINIKVDREERPDLDKIYQLAHQALTRRGGGWPLTVFLDPHTLIPLYAGTYFPKTPRYGMPSFSQVLEGVQHWHADRPDEVHTQTDALKNFLSDYGHEPVHEQEFNDHALQKARHALVQQFDSQNGGRRGGPKFPQAAEMHFMLDLAANDDVASTIATTTLSRMASRGLYDLAGGFFRYCVDEYWHIPHFEKMLYDNALLLSCYAKAAAQFNAPQFQHTALGVMRWLDDEMRLDNGMYCSAIDADSEGEEGKFYLWRQDDFRDIVTEKDYAIASQFFGLDQLPNFEDSHWHLHAKKTMASIAKDENIAIESVSLSIEKSRQALKDARALRTPPQRDTKQSTAWNALLADSFIHTYHYLGRIEDLQKAETILRVLQDNYQQRQYLPAVLNTDLPGFLDEHAYALAATVNFLKQRFSITHLTFANQLAETLLDAFEDKQLGGFFFTRDTHEPLPQRPKPWLDDSTPSGNAVAAKALLELGYLMTEPRYLDAAEKTLRAAWVAINELPHSALSMLNVLKEIQNPTPLIVIRGPQDICEQWRDSIFEAVRTTLSIYCIDDTQRHLPESICSKPTATEGAATICIGMQCLEVCYSTEQVLTTIQQNLKATSFRE
jgi:uncharacterized protein